MDKAIQQEKKTGTNNKNIKNIIILVVAALLIVGVFAYLVNKPAPSDSETVSVTAVQQILSKDLSSDYPPTPKEVVRYYSELTQCFYNEPCTDEEVADLASKSRELFDAALIANQTEEQYLEELKITIASYKSAKRTISSYSVSSSANVEYYDYEGAQWAKLNCVYSMKEGRSLIPTKEEFLLRKDEDGRWKIFGWQLIEDNEND